MSETIIKTDKAVIRQQKITILKEVTLEIQSGEFIYIIGKVGSGKSSFLKTLYAELPLDYGNIEVAGFQLKKIKKSQIPLLRRKCGIVFQDFKLLTDRNVYANLEFVLKATGWKNKKSIQERIDTVLEKVEMPDKKFKMPHELSGGEQQRIVLARALLNAPPLILADEPTGNIDPETSYRLIELLKDLCDNGKTVIIATHQYDLIQKYPGRVLRCENGTLSEDPELSVRPHTPAPTEIESIENIPVEADIVADDTVCENSSMPDILTDTVEMNSETRDEMALPEEVSEQESFLKEETEPEITAISVDMEETSGVPEEIGNSEKTVIESIEAEESPLSPEEEEPLAQPGETELQKITAEPEEKEDKPSAPFGFELID